MRKLNTVLGVKLHARLQWKNENSMASEICNILRVVGETAELT